MAEEVDGALAGRPRMASGWLRVPAVVLLLLGVYLVGDVTVDGYRSSVRRVQDSRLGAPGALEHYAVLSCIRDALLEAVAEDEPLFVELPVGLPLGDEYWIQRLNELVSPERRVVRAAVDATVVVQVVAHGTELVRAPRSVVECGSPNFVSVDLVVFDGS